MMDFLGLEESTEQFIPDKVKQEVDPHGQGLGHGTSSIVSLFSVNSPEMDMEDPLFVDVHVDGKNHGRRGRRVRKQNLTATAEKNQITPRKRIPAILRKSNRVQKKKKTETLNSEGTSKNCRPIVENPRTENSTTTSTSFKTVVLTIKNLLGKVCKENCNICEEMILQLSRHVSESEGHQVPENQDDQESDSEPKMNSYFDEDGRNIVEFDSEPKVKCQPIPISTQSKSTPNLRKIRYKRSSDRDRDRHRSYCLVCRKRIYSDRLEEHMKSHAPAMAKVNDLDLKNSDQDYTLKDRVQAQVMEKLLEEVVQRRENQGSAEVQIENLNIAPKSSSKHVLIYCDICNAKFFKTKNLEQHIKNLHDPNKFKFACNECGIEFRTTNLLGRHFRAKHPGASKFPFNCSICNKGYSKMADLKTHVFASHVKQKRYSCGFEGCDKKFYAKKYMVIHEKRHGGGGECEKTTYCCEICGKSYYSLHDLNTHRRLQHKEKNFKCDQCTKCFVYKDKLDRHKLIHTGDKPHVCDQCGKSFRQKSVLNTHYKLHTGERVHKCMVCGKNYILSAQLRIHMTTHNSDSN